MKHSNRWLAAALSLSMLSLPVFAAPAVPSAVAKASFDRGEKALEAGKFDDAVREYQEAVKATPGYAAALNGMGSALFKLNKRDEAIASFKSATEADPAFKLAWFNLGYSARKTSDFATAASAYEKYTALDPADTDGLYGLAESYKGLNQGDKAIAAYENYLKKETRASEQKWIDRAKESLAALKASAAAAPAVAPAAAAVSVAEKAPDAPREIAAPMPTLAVKKMAEGDKAMAEKRYRDASFSYQDATNADPGNVEAQFKLGNTFAMLGYYAQAIERWQKVAQLTPDAAVKKSAEDNIARAQTKIATAGGASPQEQNKAPGTGIIDNSTRAQARQFYEQGVQQISQRRYAEALNSLSSCLQLEPALTYGYIARGSTLIGLRRYSEAAVDYNYALRLDPNQSAPLYGLAEAYRALNRIDDARNFYQRYVASTAPDVRPELQNDARVKLDALK